MDWFDHYLDAISNSKNSVFPPDSFISRYKNKLNIQQKRFFSEQKAYMDLDRQMRIQEARLALESHRMSHSAIAEGIGADSGSDSGSKTLETTDLILETNTKDLLITNLGEFLSVGNT